MRVEQLHELLYQALETEMGGISVYQTAIRCARDPDLRKQWEEYLDQTKDHEETLRLLLETFDLDPDAETPGREVVRHLASCFVTTMELAMDAGGPDAAELVAAECVVLAETKDHLNWELIAEAAGAAKGEQKKALDAACRSVEDEEDEHLYHTSGWARELWISALGLPAALPPPEEVMDVHSAIASARAKAAREDLL